MLAYAPHYPVPRQEYWYFVLAEIAENAVLGMARVSLMEAEALAAQEAESQLAKPAKAAAKLPNNGAAQQADSADGVKPVSRTVHQRLPTPSRDPYTAQLHRPKAASNRHDPKAVTWLVSRSARHCVHHPNFDAYTAVMRRTDPRSSARGALHVQDAQEADSRKRQTVDIKFMAFVPGRKEYSLLVMSDCWLGVDAVVPVKLKVNACS